MTTKEIAAAVNKTERSVRNWIVKTADKISSVAEKNSSAGHGKSANYTLEETIAIIETGLGKNAAAIFKQNAESKNDIKPVDGGLLTEKDLALVAAIVSNVFNQLDKRVANIENRIEQRQALLPAPDIKPRDHINKVVREYATKQSIDFKTAYAMLYSEALYRLHINLTLGAKRQGISTLEYAESIEVIDGLLAIAIDIFK